MRSYTEEQKGKIEPIPVGGAIQAYHEGRSELKPKQVGEVHHAFGIRYGASLSRAISGSGGVQLRPFSDVYGGSYAPDISFFFEFQPFRSEFLGSLGLIGMAGIGYFQSTGQFSIQLNRPGATVPIPQQTNVKFQFLMVPVTLGIAYRFNFLNFLKPYIIAGPTSVGYLEVRSDRVPANRGHSEALFFSAGASILLDWLSSGTSWDLYSNYGIHHYYLSIDYTRLSSFSGELSMTIQGITAGLTFEY
jgi:hypothetical protein